MTKRHLSPSPEASASVEEFVESVDERLSAAGDLHEVVFEVVAELHGDRDLVDRHREGAQLSPVERARVRSYDPREATLESEYYAELAVQQDEWARSKPLQYLWRQFDNTPLADDVDLAHAFRQMLAEHLFESVGEGCRFFRGITFTYGHNVEMGDNVVVHDDVHLDDRGELVIGDRASLSDGVHVYTHDHDVVDQTEVTNYRTVIEDDVRLTFDSMVRAGCKVGRNALIGARGVVQADVPAHHIAVGTPAESIAVKPGFEDVAAPVEDAQVERRDERRIEYDYADADFEALDEFQRDLDPAGG
jgi:acetyltransferase-like isoleucine patch superfamily enzyme